MPDAAARSASAQPSGDSSHERVLVARADKSPKREKAPPRYRPKTGFQSPAGNRLPPNPPPPGSPHSKQQILPLVKIQPISPSPPHESTRLSRSGNVPRAPASPLPINWPPHDRRNALPPNPRRQVHPTASSRYFRASKSNRFLPRVNPKVLISPVLKKATHTLPICPSSPIRYRRCDPQPPQPATLGPEPTRAPHPYGFVSSCLQPAAGAFVAFTTCPCPFTQ